MFKSFCILLPLAYLIVNSVFPPKIEAGEIPLQPCPDTPNCVSSLAKDSKHFIEPLIVYADLPNAKVVIQNLLQSMPRVSIVEHQANYIKAEFVSKVLRFTDDVEFFFLQKSGEGQSDQTIVHLRSASRIGYSDLGANRRRIEEIREQLKVQLLKEEV